MIVDGGEWLGLDETQQRDERREKIMYSNGSLERRQNNNNNKKKKKNTVQFSIVNVLAQQP